MAVRDGVEQETVRRKGCIAGFFMIHVCGRKDRGAPCEFVFFTMMKPMDFTPAEFLKHYPCEWEMVTFSRPVRETIRAPCGRESV